MNIEAHVVSLLLCIGLAFALASSRAYGDTWPYLMPYTIVSPDGRLVVRIAPGAVAARCDGNAPFEEAVGPHEGVKLTYYRLDDVRGFEKMYSFRVPTVELPVSAYVSNSGRLLFIDDWFCVGKGVVVRIFDSEGNLVQEFSLSDIVGDAAVRDLFSVSTMSVHWQCRSGVVSMFGETVTVRDADSGVHRFDLESGSLSSYVSPVPCPSVCCEKLEPDAQVSSFGSYPGRTEGVAKQGGNMINEALSLYLVVLLVLLATALLVYADVFKQNDYRSGSSMAYSHQLSRALWPLSAVFFIFLVMTAGGVASYVSKSRVMSLPKQCDELVSESANFEQMFRHCGDALFLARGEILDLEFGALEDRYHPDINIIQIRESLLRLELRSVVLVLVSISGALLTLLLILATLIFRRAINTQTGGAGRVHPS